ncbi:MAG: YncE family protein [Candidatus Babeliales bacterium]|nr:YncE family protein [Candidatus Babeliales bacterium]
MMIGKIQGRYFLSFLFLLMPMNTYMVAPNTVVATINVGVTPAGLAVTPDSRFAYVANNNNYSLVNGDTVSVLDLTNNLLFKTISDASFSEPYTVTINAAGTRAYVTNSNSTTITIIDIATNAVIGTIGGFDGPSGMAITPSGALAYVNNYGGPGGVGSGNATTVRVVDLNSNTIIGAPIVVGLAPASLAITPNGAFVYVINYVTGNPGTGTISVIRTSDNTVVDTIPGFSGPFAIAITPDGKYAYVTNFGSNNFMPIGTTVSVVDLSTNTISATIELAIQPSGIAITPDGRYAYASNYDTLYTDTSFSSLVPGQGTINIIDIATNTVIPPIIAVGQSPDAVAISPNGQFAYVSNYTSNSVSVIALQSFQIVAQGCKTKNVFLTQRDLINKLTWSASGSSLPVSYSIYRDAALTDLVAMVPATGPLQFFDHNRKPNVVYTYYVVGANAVGTTSDPLSVTVTKNC